MKTERTTVVLQRPLLQRVRKVAKERGLSLSGLIALLIHEGLRSLSQQEVSGYEFKPTIVNGTGEPRVDVSDRNSLYDVLDSEKWKG